jgi:PAS domain S-box-containing protein
MSTGQTRQATPRSEERLRLLIDSIKDFAIYMLDREGRITSWNPGAQRIKGYSEAEVIGRDFSIFYTPEDVRSGKPAQFLGAALAGGRVEDEGWRVRKDGSRFWADVVLSRIDGESGDPIGFVKVTRDLTARKQAEEALRAGEERLRLLIESVRNYAIFMLDPQGIVTSWNPGAERLNGYSAGEIIGQSVSRFYPEEDIRAGKPALELSIAAESGRFEEEGWRVRNDGSQFWASVVLSAIRDGSGKLIGYTNVTWDTERRRVEEGVRYLYEISKLLTSFDDVEDTISAIVGLVAQAIPLRSAIFIREAANGSRSIVWRAEGESAEGLRAARIHARASYGYLVRSDVDLEGDETARPLPRVRTGSQVETASSFILLPLVVERRAIFGALQLEAASRPYELDLVFINAVVNQLAVALDRLGTIEARQVNLETRRAVAELREAQTGAERSWLKTVVDRLPAGVIIGEAPSGKLLLANRQAEQIWGRPLRLGAALDEYGEYRGLHPGDGRPYEPEEWPLSRSIAKGEIVVDEEIDYLHSDGTRGTMLVSSTPIESPDGRIVSGVATFYDITERRHHEKTQHFLAEASAVLGSSLEHGSPVAAAIRLAIPLLADVSFLDEVGEDGEVRRLEVAFADPRHADLADHFRQLASGPGLPTPQATVLQSGKPLLLADLASADLQNTGEGMETLRAAGIRSMIVVPLLARGQMLGALTFARRTPGPRYSPEDLALAQEVARRIALAIDNARLYQHAQRATRTRDDLIAAVSHDLRTPLGTVISTAELLAMSEAPNEKREKWVEALRRSAGWMKRLIDDLVDIARIEAGRFTIQERRCAVGGVLKEALTLMQPLAQQKKLRLEAKVSGAEVDVPCDRDRILRVLSNLIGNAIKFTPEGGSISVTAEQGRGEVRFAVSDNGSGIPATELPHIFERFWQARKTARMGAGLGLAIAQGIVDAHGGRIWAESELGKGSTFFFTLPLDQPGDGSGTNR